MDDTRPAQPEATDLDRQIHEYMQAGTVLDRISSELYLSTEGLWAARLSTSKLHEVGEAGYMLYNNVAKFGGEYSASIILVNLADDLIATRALLATAEDARTVYRESSRRQEVAATLASVMALVLAIVAVWLWLR